MRTGLNILATIDTGTLYKNENNVGTGTLVQNGDTLYITMRASDEYDTSVSSALMIANRNLEFTVTTKQESSI